MSYFNSDQLAYMDDLARIDPSTKCWCGWFLLGQCHSCRGDATCADKLAVRCPDRRCHAADEPIGWPGHRGYTIHTIYCWVAKGALIASNLASAYRPETTTEN